MKSGFKAILATLVLIAGSGVMVWLFSLSKPPEKLELPVIVPVVECEEVRLEPDVIRVVSRGEVQPRYVGEIAAEVGGVVREVSGDFEKGVEVKAAGEPLIRLDGRDYATLEAQALGAIAQAELALELELAQGAVAREEWQAKRRGEVPALVGREPQIAAAKASLEAARGQLEQVRRDMKRCEIRAPYDGIVKERKVAPGMVVARGTGLGQIISLEKKISLPVLLEDSMFVEPGAEVVYTARAGSRKGVYRGRILRSGGEIDRQTRSRTFEATVEPGAGQAEIPLEAGMYLTAEIDVKGQPGRMRIPRRALHENAYVYIIDGDNFIQKRKVEVLWGNREHVVLQTPDGGAEAWLRPGDRVCLTALEDVVPGKTKVEIKR